MKAFPAIVKLIGVAALTYFFVRLYLQSNYSEQFWTLLNGELSDGERPGLASDIELIISIVFSVAISVAAISAIQKVVVHVRGENR